MKKILILAFLLGSLVGYSQWDIRAFPTQFPALKVQDSLRLDYLGSASDSVLLFRLPNGTIIQGLTIAQVRGSSQLQGLIFNDVTNVLTITDGNGVDLSSLAGGSGGLNDTIIISGGRDTISNNSEEVLFLSENLTGEDTLYLAPNLVLDSLSNVYIENHRGGTLVVIGGLNSLNESINTVLTIPTRGGLFIRCLGIINGVRRYSAIGNYTE